jgi:hypothetical protein
MNNKPSNSLKVIKRHFKPGTELSKELNLYRTVSTEKFRTENKAEKFVDAVVKARKDINEAQLRRDKYNLIKDLKNSFNIADFFKSRVNNYKLQASTYKLFEFAEADDPKEYVDSKFTLIEHVQNNPNIEKRGTLIEEQNKDVRILASKIVVDKFNKKYSVLNKEQKRTLREYINNVTNSVKLKHYVLTETKKLQDILKSLKSNVPSKVVRIKLNEVVNLLNELKKKHVVQDKDVLTMLRYYELVNELKKIGDK